MFDKEEGYQILDIKHMFENSVEKYKERAAFWIKKNKNEACYSLSYDEAYKDVRGLGTSLMAIGMKGKKIAIIGVNSYEWAISYLATICGTGVAVLLDKEFCINELKHYLTITECSCAIFSGELEDVFWQIRNDGVTYLETLINMDKKKSEWDILSLRELIDNGKEMVASGNHDFTNIQIIPEELCAIMFTSGTTDVPKGVCLSHENISTEIRLVSTVLNISVNNVFFSRLPLHCASECICSILLPLYKGASVAYGDVSKRNFEIISVQGYSITESSSIVTLNPYDGATGLLLPEMKLKIYNPDLETGIGEICLKGKNIMMGYCDNQEATAEILKDGWLHTGDLGMIDKKGYIYIAGRKESVIITENGKNVYPEELEKYLSNNIPYILESMVWSKNSDNDRKPVITATIFVDKNKVVEKLGANYTKRELEKLIWNEISVFNEKLPYYKRIEKIVLRKEEFQKNSCNKICRWYPANRE